MRILLATAVAIAPLLAAAGAQAEIVISSDRTTPIRTSNATGTAADNIRIASGGSITLTSGTAVRYKYIRKDGAGNVLYEGGVNRSFTPTGTSLTRTETWQ